MYTAWRVARMALLLLCSSAVAVAAQARVPNDDLPLVRVAAGGGVPAITTTSAAAAAISNSNSISIATPNAANPIADAQLPLPVADAGPDAMAMVGVPTVIDGSQSHDPRGQLITFHWRIAQAPHGSVAALAPDDPAPVFVADLPGIYRLQLVVVNEDAVASQPAEKTLVAFAERPLPNVRAGANRQVAVGAKVELDAGMSDDLLHLPLDFHWSLVSAPRASRVRSDDIVARDSVRPWFTPDVAGPYVIRLQASNGEFVSEDRTTVTATSGNLNPIAIAAAGAVATGNPLVLDGTTSVDPDNGPSSLGFAWSLVSRPPYSTLAGDAIRNAQAATANVTPDAEGAYVFRLNVTDGEASDADNVLVRYAATQDARRMRDAALRNRGGSAAGSSANVATTIMAKRLPAGFDLVVSPARLQVVAGGEATVAIALGPRGAISSAARLEVTGLPPGVAAIFATPGLAIGERTTLTLRATANVRAGSYPLQVVASSTFNGAAIMDAADVQLVVATAQLGSAERPTCGAADLSALHSSIYVAPNGSHAADCGGSAANACASIQQGIDHCSAGCGVLVRYGRYATTATITLKDGVSVYGGCHFDGAPVAGSVAANYRTLIDAVPPLGMPALSAEAINTPTVVSGLVVLSEPAQQPGAPVIVMTASHSKGITLANSALIAGSAVAGGIDGPTPAGGEGGTGSSPAQAAPNNGGQGGVACAANPSNGPGHGGQGGDYQAITPNCGILTCTCTNTNPASTGRDGVASGVAGGAGGKPGGAGCGCARVDGVPDGDPGKAGAVGACGVNGGTPGDPFGVFNGARWTAGSSGSGDGGSVGSGGGGGGSGGMSAFAHYSESTLYAGLPGGGGGGGGCGGPGGKGGGQGGASIALMLVDSTMSGVPDGNSIVPGPGGPGGVGGNGAIGGQGGPGAYGSLGHTTHLYKSTVCSADVAGGGGHGGPGGQGGAGGGGGAGSGGPSIGIALVAGSPNPGSTVGIYAALPGPPGKPGGGGKNAPQPAQPNPCTGAVGGVGIAGAGTAVLAVDRLSPARLLLPGQRLRAEQSLFSPNGTNELAMQNDGNLCFKVSRTPVWCTATNWVDDLYVIMQPDGNLTMHEESGNTGRVWYESYTSGHPGSYLAVQDNGQLVIYSGGEILWSRP